MLSNGNAGTGPTAGVESRSHDIFADCPLQGKVRARSGRPFSLPAVTIFCHKSLKSLLCIMNKLRNFAQAKSYLWAACKASLVYNWQVALSFRGGVGIFAKMQLRGLLVALKLLQG